MTTIGPNSTSAYSGAQKNSAQEKDLLEKIGDMFNQAARDIAGKIEKTTDGVAEASQQVGFDAIRATAEGVSSFEQGANQVTGELRSGLEETTNTVINATGAQATGDDVEDMFEG